MWYRISQAKLKGLEETIMEGDAENLLRHHLYLMGDYNPDRQRINRLVKRVMSKILDEYKNYNLVRHYVQGETLYPAVEKAVKEVLKKKK
jgi:hypothetical protein